MRYTFKLCLNITWVLLLVLGTVALPLAGMDREAMAGNDGWTIPVEISTNAKAWSPSLTVDSKGIVHAVWLGASDPNPPAAGDTIYYCRWNGIEWSEPVDVFVSAVQRNLGSPVIRAHPDDKLYVVWRGRSGMIYLSTAPAAVAELVRQWTPPRIILEGANFTYDLDLESDRSGLLHLAFVQEFAGVSVITYSRSDDGGQTWARPAQISDSKTDTLAWNPRVAIGKDGTIHATWAEVPLPGTWPPQGVLYARSIDDGQTWSVPFQVAEEGYGRANVGLSDERTVHLVWSGTVGWEGRYHIRSADGGQTWSEIARLPGLQESFGTSFSEMVVDDTGVLHLAAGVNQQRYLTWKDGVWSLPEKIADVIPDRALVREGGMPRIELTEGNRLIVLYHDNWNIFFATRLVDAPHWPIPTAVPALPSMPDSRSGSSELTPSVLPTAIPLPPFDNPAATRPSATSSIRALIFGTVPVLLLLVGVVLYRTSCLRK